MPAHIDNLKLEPAPSDDEISRTESRMGISLPKDYKEFLKTANGAEGFISENAFIIIWAIEKIVDYNKMYEVSYNMPGIVLFGTNGGVGAYGFDTRSMESKVIEVPFIPMNWGNVIATWNSFSEFLQNLHEEG